MKITRIQSNSVADNSYSKKNHKSISFEKSNLLITENSLFKALQDSSPKKTTRNLLSIAAKKMQILKNISNVYDENKSLDLTLELIKTKEGTRIAAGIEPVKKSKDGLIFARTFDELASDGKKFAEEIALSVKKIKD